MAAAARVIAEGNVASMGALGFLAWLAFLVTTD